jgi:hypothetical protein
VFAQNWPPMGYSKSVKSAIVAILIASLFCSALSADSGSGTVCVAPNSEKPPTRISPGGSYNPATLLLQIDKRDAVHWPHKDSIKIDGLSITEQHLVVLISDGKRIQSFWFRFADYRTEDLCIAFDGYQGVQLQEAKRSPWCKCK